MDTKVKYDRYAAAAEQSELQKFIHVTMFQYEFASHAWSLKFNNDPSGLTAAEGIAHTILKDAFLSKCSSIKDLLASVSPKMIQKKDGSPDYAFIGIMVSNSPGSVWACASTQLAQAETLLGQR